jgi:hypothetical protein
MCDALVLVNNSNNTAGVVAYNKELSFLLANLPDSCKVSKEFVSCSDRKKKEADLVYIDTDN